MISRGNVINEGNLCRFYLAKDCEEQTEGRIKMKFTGPPEVGCSENPVSKEVLTSAAACLSGSLEDSGSGVFPEYTGPKADHKNTVPLHCPGQR